MSECWFCRDRKHDDCIRKDHDGNTIPNSEDDCSCKQCHGGATP